MSKSPFLPNVTLFTVNEVATAFRVSKMTIYRLITNGELVALRVGNSFRVPETAVHAFLADHAPEATSA